ncbi:MAG TPA: MFS transporter [Lichenihabitans sp.]|jgi:MFS family permease|nr:MFS transporter [Lichenihabitans sp.]
MALEAPRIGWARIKPVVQVASGNFLEMYDFFVFAYYASAIGKAYFPKGDGFAQLMLALATFGVGFLMRPVGALVLGAYMDHRGRRAGLILTLALMSVGTLSVALTPNYAVIGLAAPLIVVAGRLLQGFSAGAELGGVSVYLSEIATPGHKGFYVSWQSASQQVAVIFAALLGVALQQALSPEQMEGWGWRLPLLIGCLIVPFIFLLRRSLVETEDFAHRQHRTASLGDVWRSLSADWPIVLIGMMLVIMTTVSFYLITAYTPTFGKDTLKLGASDSLLVTLCVGVSNLFWLPVSGALSDRIGRRPILVACTVLALVTAYPAMIWLASAPSFDRLLAVELWLSFIYGVYNGAMVVHLTEIMPASVKGTGFSMAYSLATTLGGFTPFICNGLIRLTGNRAMPGLWLSFAAAIGLAAMLLERRHAASRAYAPSPMAGGLLPR